MFWQKKDNAKEQKAHAESGSPVIAAVLMEGDSFPLADLETVISEQSICGQRVGSLETQKGILNGQIGDEMLFVAPMPAPFPWSDLKGPCATSWMWPKETPAATLEQHRTHVLITIIGGKSDPISRRLVLLQVTAIVAGMPGVVGVYWPDATLVHYPPVFVKMARALSTRERLPLYLLVDFRLFRNSDNSLGLFTTGLGALGQMEMEIPRISMKPGEVREWAIKIAYYLLDAGAKVKDGDTIGFSAEQQIRIQHQPSLFGKSGTVMRLGS